ncbi:DUF934 domain-containing protein [Alkalilacustris brevis]|uniref:DUF934 domain-containing protein n=1 Tax=Alkalilacustris brevis TaxID=2026338 RepID=UPI000E0D53B7|nr:DUF934 domain-containing protein [Alkalilacustris brevis]
MSVIVTDQGFQPEHWKAGFTTPDALPDASSAVALDLASDDDPATLVAQFDRIALIRVHFAHFADGRGFTLAQRLRQLGYTGRLRAHGHVLADQYTMARRCGFDEVEISAGLAHRQPQEHWRFRGNWRHHDYQSRLRA